MSRISVLAFIDWYKPGNKSGGTVTAFSNFVENLEDKIDFKIVTRDRDFSEKKPYGDIVSNKWIRRDSTKIIYLSENKINIFEIYKIIKNENYNFLYLNGLFSFYFSVFPLLFSKNFSKKIVNSHGMLSSQAFSQKKYKKKIFFFIMNLFSMYRNVIFHVANKEELIDVNKIIRKKIEVKIARQFPRKINWQIKNIKPKNKIKKYICLSRISYEKGIHLMIKSLNYVTNNIVLNIYGPIHDQSYWTLCQNYINDLPENITVNYKGLINSDDVMNTIRNYDFSVLFSYGENFGHSILESFAAGTPVLTSKNTPWNDLELKKIGWNVDLDIKKIGCLIQKTSNLNYIRIKEMSDYCFIFAKKYCLNKNLIQQNLKLFYD